MRSSYKITTADRGWERAGALKETHDSEATSKSPTIAPHLSTQARIALTPKTLSG
jgi:hypothetical protein